MLQPDIIQHRLTSQQITQPTYSSVGDAVAWMGAIQAQDYAAAKWALGMRAKGATDATIEDAFNSSAILRTHVMRPTWHFVTPQDIGWMLNLTAPRILPLFIPMAGKVGMGEALFKKSSKVLAKALQGKFLDRAALKIILGKAGIATDDIRFTHIMMRAELDRVVCSGPRHGKQFTYALYEERVPEVKPISREEALAALALRYFTSHGPATLHDFAWWSGLTMTDAKAGAEMNKHQLLCEKIGEKQYWLSPDVETKKQASGTAHLLSNYDEYIVGYADRSDIIDPSFTKKGDARGNILFNNTAIIDGKVIATWRRTFKKDEALIEVSPLVKMNKENKNAISAAAAKYAEFHGLRAVVSYL